MTKLENSKIIIVTHVYATGPAQDLKEYLINNKIKKLLFIGHPLFFDKKLNGSGYEIYENGKQMKEKYKKIKKMPVSYTYLKDVFLNLIWPYKNNTKWNLYIGNDNLNTFSGILLKWLGKVDKVVYYVIDYNPNRFQNKLLNKIYHILDQFCVKYSDETWNLSPRMEPARKEYFGFSGGNQHTVSVGIWFKRIKQLDFSQIKKHQAVFMGHILEKQGIQYVVDAIPLIIKKISDFSLLIIGDGNYLDQLKKKTKKLNIEKFVKFTGYIKDHEEVEKMLSSCAVALALYEQKDKNGLLMFTYFADPAKIKSYLASGLPVLLSDVSYNAKEIEQKKCGKIITNDKKQIADAIIELLQNEKLLNEYRKNAINYAQQFDWNDIFKKNLNRILYEI